MDPNFHNSNSITVTETELDKELLQVLIPINAFLDSRFDDATNNLNDEKLYDTLVNAAICSLKAVMSWESSDIDIANQALSLTQFNASSLKSQASLMSSLYQNYWKGESEWDKGSRLQRHGQICAAEGWLIKAALSLMDPQLAILIKEIFNVRKSYITYKTAYSSIVKEFEDFDGQDLQQFLHSRELDENLVCAILFGWGMGQLVLSFLPPTLLKLFAAVGIRPDINLGLGLLELASGQRIEKRWMVEKGQWKPCPWMLKIAPLGTTKPLVRHFLAKSALIGYHVLLPSMWTTLYSSTELGKRLLQQELEKHPNAFHYNIARARLETGLGNSHGALEIYADLLKRVELKGTWSTLTQVVHWDMSMASMAALKWQDAYNYLEILERESKWTNITYSYAMAVSIPGPDSAKRLKETSQVNLNHYAGKSVPLEKFVRRKSRNFVRDGRLILGRLEFGYFFNTFECMNLNQLTIALEEIEAANAETVDEQVIKRFLRGVVKREMSLSTKHWIVAINPTPILGQMTKLVQEALDDWNWIFENGKDIRWDHLYVPLARFETSRTLARIGRWKEAIQACELAAYGGYPEKEAKKMKWKVGKWGSVKASMDSWTAVRVHNWRTRLEMEATQK